MQEYKTRSDHYNVVHIVAIVKFVNVNHTLLGLRHSHANVSTRSTVTIMAKPNKKGPVKTVDIFCAKCKTLLFKYQKAGKGALVKCFISRIVHDYTATPCLCPSCGGQFSREAMIRGMPSYKMIGGKVIVK
jgi:hypothetical protein